MPHAANKRNIKCYMVLAMAVNKETHVNASVVMEVAVYEKLKVLAQKNKRSVSKQILYWIEEKLDESENR